MNPHELEQTLNHLLSLEAETEVAEFKEAKSTYDFSKLGKYFSALSNEANLNRKSCAWLVFGVENKKHQVVGSQFRPKRKDLDNLKGEIANKTINRITFIEIYEYPHSDGRVVLFQIPPAPQGLPVAFEGHYYGRDGEELVPLNLEEFERIRSQHIENDWSAKVVKGATISDLDRDALNVAREKFKEKNKESAFYDEIDTWSDATFLDKVKITVNGKITNTALLLLGKEESIHYLSPVAAEITWKLDMQEKAYEHYSVPFLLTTTQVMERIRNYKVKFYPDNSMLAVTVDKYDSRSILEAIHNCVAHQDYARNARIIVTEQVDKITFSNAGAFFEGNPEEYSFGTKTPEKYRNQWLARAMVNLGMIDRLGYGIHSLYISQKDRFFPLPEYAQSDSGGVILQIYGQTIDERYSKMLIEHRNLSLPQVILLDRVQKGKAIADDAASMLRKEKLIEGRKPNYYISDVVARTIEQKAAYTKNKAFDKQYYLDLIMKSITQHGNMTRREIDELLWKKLPDWMSDEQRANRIHNLIAELRNKRLIKNDSNAKNSNWILDKSDNLD